MLQIWSTTLEIFVFALSFSSFRGDGLFHIHKHSFIHSFIQPMFTKLLLDTVLGTGHTTGTKTEIPALAEELALATAGSLLPCIMCWERQRILVSMCVHS